MKTTKTIVILLALVLLTAAMARSDEKPAKKEISNTRTASCLVKITTDEAVLPLSEFVVEDLLRSSGVAGKAAREVLEISPDIAAELFEIEENFGVDSALGGYGGGTGGMGIPPGTTVPGRRSPTPTRTPTRIPTAVARTARPPTPTTTTTRRPYPTRTTTPTRHKPTLTQPLPSTTEQTILFHLRVDFSQADNAEDIKPAAEEFMIALIDNLRNALSGAFHEYHDKLNKQLEFADKEASRAQHELVQMQRELRDISDSRDLSRYVILKDIGSLRQKLQSTTMQRASDEMLYEATAKQIAKEEKRRRELVGNDPITREFESILEVHEKRLKETQKLYDSGRASAADIQDIREKIIRAKIELAQRREQIINPAGGVEISSLNDELATLSIQTDLAQQEMKILEQQLEKAKEQLKDADTYELLSLKADIARQNLEETLLWRARLGRNIRSIQPPDVTVIGAE